MHKHHIVFKSQGGLDFELNYKYLSTEDHEGSNGPHMNKRIDLLYKKELQNLLYCLFSKPEYSIKEIAKVLGKSTRYMEKHFRSVPSAAGIYQRENIIRKLMGGKLY